MQLQKAKAKEKASETRVAGSAAKRRVGKGARARRDWVESRGGNHVQGATKIEASTTAG